MQSPQAADESARVAQLKDELEKRDRVISSLRKENERLQVRVQGGHYAGSTFCLLTNGTLGLESRGVRISWL